MRYAALLVIAVALIAATLYAAPRCSPQTESVRIGHMLMGGCQ